MGLALALALLLLAPAPPAAVDFSSDQFLFGTWTCEVDNGDGTHGVERATYTFVLDKHWLRSVATATAATPGSAPTSTHVYESFDRSSGKWVRIAIGSNGEYSVTDSAGWQDGVKTYSPAANAPQTFRLVATKVDQNAFTQETQAPDSTGKWQRTRRMSCKRSPATAVPHR